MTTTYNKTENHLLLMLSIAMTFILLLVLFSYTHSTNAETISRNISSTLNMTTAQLAKPQIQWSTYTNNKFGFSVEYPNTWEVQEKQNRFLKGPDLIIQSNASILGTNYGKFTFGLVGETPFNDVTVLTNVAVKEIVGNFEPGYEKRLIEHIDTKKYKIGGEEAGAFTYVLEKKDYLSDSTTTYITPGTAAEVVNTIHNSQDYILQFIASAQNFDNPNLTEIRQHMFNSIKWLG